MGWSGGGGGVVANQETTWYNHAARYGRIDRQKAFLNSTSLMRCCTFVSRGSRHVDVVGKSREHVKLNVVTVAGIFISVRCSVEIRF
jgi:hypothetical protein